MHPILLSLLLGLTAAAANVFGGTIIVQKNWDRSYLKYFVALGAGFMLAVASLKSFLTASNCADEARLSLYSPVTCSFTSSSTRSRPTFTLARKPIPTSSWLRTKAFLFCLA